jgi:hypothetical protein
VSDLQCPARFLLLTDPAAREALADRLAGVPVAATHDLADGTDRAKLFAAIEDWSDMYRGETVVVRLAPETVAALPGWLREREADGVIAVEVDADGWR